MLKKAVDYGLLAKAVLVPLGQTIKWPQHKCRILLDYFKDVL